MEFINEEISEEDKEKYYSLHLKGPYTGKELKAYKWTVDKEKNIYLIPTEKGRDLDHPDFFVFIWKDIAIKIEAYLNRSLYPEYHWNITQVQMPISLEKEQEIIYKTLYEAFKTFGCLFRDEYSDVVFFDYIATPSYFKDREV